MFQKIKSFLFENRTAKQTIAKNTVWLFTSNFAGRLLKAVIIIYAARALGTENYGVFSYALTLAGFFTVFVDPGVNSMVMREVPKSPTEEGRRRILATTLVIKLVLIAAAVLVVLFIAPLFSTLPGAVALLPVMAFIIIFDTAREFFLVFIRANEKMEWEAGIFLFTNLVIVIAGFILLSHSKTPLALSWAYAAGAVVGAAAAVIVLRKSLARIFSYFSPHLIRSTIVSAWPFAITGALGVLLTNTDILIISWMRSAPEVGVYSAAIRIIQVLYVLPIIFQFSTLPLLARLARADDARFRRVLERTTGLILLTSMPMAVGGVILGTHIMQLIFGAPYAPGGLAFKFLMIGLVVDYPAAIMSAAIFAYNRQKSLIAASLIGGIVNIIFDLVLIPPFGIAGSAFGTLLTQIATNWYLWHTMQKINYFEVLPQLKKVAMASILMGAMTTFLLVIGANTIANIAISGVFYFSILYFFRERLLGEMGSAFKPAAIPVA